MDYQIFSQINCAIKINGEYKGILTFSPQCFSLKEQDFIELIPLDNLQPINFVLSSPPSQVKILNTSTYNYLYPTHFTCQNLGYRKLYYKQFSNLNISVVLDCECKITFDLPNDSITETIPFIPVNISLFYKDSRHIGLLFKQNKQLCIIFDIENCKIVFYKIVNSAYAENNTIYSTILPPTICSHQITYCFFKGEITRKISREKAPYLISNKTLFCYAFLECVSLGDNLQDFLDSSLPQDKIISFLGDFDYVIYHAEHNKFALIGKQVKYVTFKLQNDKIIDLETC